MRHFTVVSDSYIADRLVASGSRITDAWLAPGTEPGTNLVETDESGTPLKSEDAARLLQVPHLAPVQVAPIAPHAPNPTAPQAVPPQPGGSVMIAGDRNYVPGDGVESNEAAEARVKSLRAELDAAEKVLAAARDAADQPEPPQRRGGDTGTAPSVLDASIPDLSKSLGDITDPAQLQTLRTQEAAGKNRAGALEAIDARYAELNA